MPRKTHRLLEGSVIGAMILGFIGMFQPWEIDLYHVGFVLLLVSTLVFIVVSHIPTQQQE